MSKKPSQKPENSSQDHVDGFEKAYGEKFENTLDLQTWTPGENLSEIYSKLEEEVQEALKDEKNSVNVIRNEILPKLNVENKVAGGGWFRHDNEAIKKAHNGFLFNGGVEACKGISIKHDTLPISITQIGIYLVSYHGEQGSYLHRLFRRDLRYKGKSPVDEVLDLIEKREDKDDDGADKGGAKSLSELAQRGILAYMEREILFKKSKANWKLGNGSPTPYELMTDFWSSQAHLTEKAIDLMESIIKHEKFVYVQADTKRRGLISLGYALHPGEYITLYTLDTDLQDRLKGGYRGEIRKKVEDFVKNTASQVAVGIFRVSRLSPPCIFYAHVKHFKMAALIAMADSILQMNKGTPMLIEIADNLCKSAFSQSELISSMQQSSNLEDNTNLYF